MRGDQIKKEKKEKKRQAVVLVKMHYVREDVYLTLGEYVRSSPELLNTVLWAVRKFRLACRQRHANEVIKE